MLMRMDEIKMALEIRNDLYWTINSKVAVVFRGNMVPTNAHLWNPEDIFVIFCDWDIQMHPVLR